MSITKCPRCGNNISSKHRFCPECAFPIWEADQVSDNLTNHPVPFSLSEEHRKFYAASEASDAAGDVAERTPNKTGKTYLVTVENGTGGGYYRPGEKVLIAAVVPEDSEYDFSGWEITEGDAILSNRMLETAGFIMPKENVSVAARLSDIKYTVTVTNGEGGGKYSAGDKVTLTADKPKGDHVFEGWEIKNGDVFLSDPGAETVCFFMPRGDVEILAVFRKKTAILTVKNGTAGASELYAGETTVITADEADSGYSFTGWMIEGNATAEDLQKEQTTLTIGSGDVIVTAKYSVIPVLKPGYELHKVFLELADSEENDIKQEYDKKIKRFCRSYTAFTGGTKTVNISKTGQSVLAWYDDIDGTIYWYSEVRYVKSNEYIGSMFGGFAALREVDFTGIDTENATNMSGMFMHCSNLTRLELSSLNTENVTDMSKMFDNCRSLSSLDLRNFNTENVMDMNSMFNECSSLASLNLNSFNTGKVTDMRWMFEGCSNLDSLDLSSFDTGKVIRMSGMFAMCSNLTRLDLSNFDTRNVIEMWMIFSNCSNLIDIKTKDVKILKLSEQF